MRGSPNTIALALRRRAHALEPALRQAEKESLQEGLRIAQALSRGSFSTRQLRQLGHPYATRAPNPPQDPAIINYQRGVFYAGWRIQQPHRTSKGLVARLLNESPNAKYLSRGTRLMIARPILARIRASLSSFRAKKQREALARVLLSGGA